MSTRATVFRSMHDVGLAAWFGGSLFGVAGLNAVAEEAGDRRSASRLTSIGWAKWSPVNTLAVAVHAVGGVGLLTENRRRVAVQRGAGRTAVAKAVVTGAALAASVYSRLLGKKIEDAVVHGASDVLSSATSHADSGTIRAGAATGVGEAAREATSGRGRRPARRRSRCRWT